MYRFDENNLKFSFQTCVVWLKVFHAVWIDTKVKEHGLEANRVRTTFRLWDFENSVSEGKVQLVSVHNDNGLL